jgi:NADPH-dependent 2,4-dienoyl-CoA reductase/sulfur reductase-like enzyme
MARGGAKPRVVVVGGGAGGATAAKYVKKNAPELDVTLVEASHKHTTPVFSNLYLGGLRSLESITHGYEALQANYGVRLVWDRAIEIDPVAKSVRLSGGGLLAYDRLVVAPGIGFRGEAIEGYDEAAALAMPHAWAGSTQLHLLKRQLEAMADGGVVVIAPPKKPYRCPPAPYERAAMIANYLKRGKPRAKILILDAKEQFSMQDLFFEAWDRFYPDLIEWLPGEINGGGAKAVDARAMTVMTDDDSFQGDVINLIPAQRAGDIALAAGLADASGWCPIDPRTMASRLQPDIHVIGDAIDPGDMPKAGFAAGHQAKLCAMAVRAALLGSPLSEGDFPGACWNFLAEGHAVRIGGRYSASEEKFLQTDGLVSEIGESDEVREALARGANDWYAGFVEDAFG